MASIAKRPDGTYRPRYRDENGKEHARHFKRKVDAQRWLDEVTASVVTGTYVDPRSGRVTFQQFAEDWRAAQVHRATTALHQETMLRRHVYPRLGALPLAHIRPSHVQGWVKWVGTTTDAHRALAPSTVRVVASIVSSIFRAAVRDRRIAANPCDGLKLPKVHKGRVEPLPVEQVQAITEAMPARYRALLTVAAGTGLRQGEVFGLTVDRVDFLRRQVTVDQQLQSLPNQASALVPPKTQASVRVVPLPQVVINVLAAHLAEFPTDKFVFTDAAGRAIRRAAFDLRVWRPAIKRAGLVGTGFHDLRHFYASLLIRHGESVKTVQARLGHASAAETLDTYTHLWPDSDDRTRAAVDDVLGTSADSLRTDRDALG